MSYYPEAQQVLKQKFVKKLVADTHFVKRRFSYLNSSRKV